LPNFQRLCREHRCNFFYLDLNHFPAQALHARLISSVMSAPCSWFDATPVGRIVNRFSQDISTVVR
jgi:hypothetical protein